MSENDFQRSWGRLSLFNMVTVTGGKREGETKRPGDGGKEEIVDRL
jgi:hypothetical protein